MYHVACPLVARLRGTVKSSVTLVMSQPVATRMAQVLGLGDKELDSAIALTVTLGGGA